MKPIFKPYQIVVVNRNRLPSGICQGGRYSHFGEVMSFPVPPASPGAPVTVMVRRVPGHPGTLEELPIEALSRANRITRVHYARVAGVGQFPVDMLRYDFAAPVNFSIDVVGDPGFERVVTTIDPKHGLDGLWVATAAATRRGGDAFTAARWQSFLWRVLETKTLPIGGNP
jgi:hypothetical protein